MRIAVNNLSKSYDGEKFAFKPSSFEIHQGEFVTLLGPSGCGKTTLLRLLAGLETGNSGQIHFDDRLIFDGEARRVVPTEKRQIGMVFQDFALWPHMTIFENVAFGLRAQKDTDRLEERVRWALAKVDLNGFETRYPRQLSGGQQQRVAFARAIVTEPELILLDEPLSALDALLRNQLRVELVSIAKELNITCVYVTHDQEEAMSMSDRIFVMRDGEILQQGEPELLYHNPTHPFVAEFVGKTNRLVDSVTGEEKIFRPEDLSLEKQTLDDLVYKAIVQHVSYLGDRYEVIVKYGQEEWTVYSKKRVAVGEGINIYLPKTSLKLTQYA